PRTFSSSPIWNLARPLTIIPICSLAWLCHSTTPPAGMSTRESCRCSPAQVRMATQPKMVWRPHSWAAGKKRDILGLQHLVAQAFLPVRATRAQARMPVPPKLHHGAVGDDHAAGHANDAVADVIDAVRAVGFFLPRFIRQFHALADAAILVQNRSRDDRPVADVQVRSAAASVVGPVDVRLETVRADDHGIAEDAIATDAAADAEQRVLEPRPRADHATVRHEAMFERRPVDAARGQIPHPRVDQPFLGKEIEGRVRPRQGQARFVVALDRAEIFPIAVEEVREDALALVVPREDFLAEV